MPRLILLVVAVFLSACGSIPRDPAPLSDLSNPEVPGAVNARLWADSTPENIEDVIALIEKQRSASGLIGDHDVLSLSGGGENGAFSAGILAAWSASGTRPEFRVVLGVSTGALAAPFAFLGPDYDDELRRLYGGLETDQIFELRNIFSILPNASINSSEPLKRLIEEYVTDEFLAKIAREHQRGRRLIVQTVSLDAQRPVIWDLGTIASSGAPRSKEVFRDVLLASAAIPGVFPPVLIEVDTPNGVRDELHVDGGVFSQSIFVPGWRLPTETTGTPTLYAILNSKITPQPEITETRITSIMSRSIATLVKSQGLNDLRLAYERSPDPSTFNATWIGEDFTASSDEPFDPVYMRALYDYGYERFQSGDIWEGRPP